MTRMRQHKRSSPRAIRRLAEQLYVELERSMYGPPADRDALVAACGPQLLFLAPLLDVFTQHPDQWEQTIRTRGKQLWLRTEPAAEASSVGWLAIQLARGLAPYLLCSRADRDRLLKSAGSVCYQDLAWIELLMIADRDRREEAVAINAALAPVLSLALSQALPELQGVFGVAPAGEGAGQ
jgi:hypothetical protein